MVQARLVLVADAFQSPSATPPCFNAVPLSASEEVDAASSVVAHAVILSDYCSLVLACMCREK
jgi:hypothetical protein